MRNKHIDANGVQLFTESFGHPSDPTALLVVGAMASAVWWPEEFCRRLAGRGRHVIRYDQRDTVRALAAEDFERTNDLRTPMNHALLSGGERWFGRLGEFT